MANEEMAPPAEGAGDDPIAQLGQGLGALVEGIQGANVPDEAKQQAQVVMAEYGKLVELLQGGAGTPMGPQAEGAGGNVNAQRVE